MQGWVDVRGNAFEQQLFCDRDLVRVGRPVMEKAIAFPVRKEIVAGMSHWLAIAESQGITFDQFMTSAEARCNLEIVVNNSDFDELQRLTLANMSLPFFVFGLCAILAFAKHQSNKLLEKKEGSSPDERNVCGRKDASGPPNVDSREDESAGQGLGSDEVLMECAAPESSVQSVDEAIEELFLSQQNELMEKVKAIVREEGIVRRRAAV